MLFGHYLFSFVEQVSKSHNFLNEAEAKYSRKGGTCQDRKATAIRLESLDIECYIFPATDLCVA